jgi:hypothetical protein
VADIEPLKDTYKYTMKKLLLAADERRWTQIRNQ